MADLKISQFADGGAVQVTDEIATNRAGINTKVFVGSAAALDAGSGVGDVITWQDDGGGNPIYPAGDGSQITNLSLPEINASNVVFSPSSGSIIVSDNVQEAIEELEDLISDLGDSLGTAAFEDVGYFATAAQGALADTAVQPQTMPAGGMHFDGSTYLNGNPLTGIADGKRGTLFVSIYVRDMPVASSWIMNATDSRVRLSMTPEGGFFLGIRNSSNTNIYTHTFNGPFENQKINILISWDLGQGIGLFCVNDVVNDTPTVMTDDVIDYTVTQYSVGANVNGAGPFSDIDIYSLYLNTDDYIDITQEANRRKFYDANGMTAAMGPHGEKVTGNKPILFMGYDSGTRFASARGSQTVGRFVINGTPSAPAVPDVCELEENAFNYSGIWTPTLTGVTNVSSLTLTQGFYSRNQNKVDCSVRNTVTAASGSDDITNYRISLPISSDITDPQDLIGNMVVVNNSDTPIRPGYIAGGSTNKDAVVTYRSGSASARDINSNFSYISKE